MAHVIDLKTGSKPTKALMKPKIRATVRQKRAVRNILAGHGKSEALLNAGYSESVAVKNPAYVTESKGFLALMDGLGLTDEYLGSKLAEDIEAKPRNRLGELTLAYKVKGRLKDDASTSSFTPATINIAIIQKGDTPPSAT